MTCVFLPQVDGLTLIDAAPMTSGCPPQTYTSHTYTCYKMHALFFHSVLTCDNLTQLHNKVKDSSAFELLCYIPDNIRFLGVCGLNMLYGYTHCFILKSTFTTVELVVHVRDRDRELQSYQIYLRVN